MRLDTLSRDFTQEETTQRWEEIVFRLNGGEMPPKGEPQPSALELGRIVEWLSTRAQEGQAARMASRGPVAHYRLSRQEYQHTVYDLLGVYYDVNKPGVFNDDPLWHGFDRVGSLLSLSPSHVEHYFKAAETVLDRAFPQRPEKHKKRRAYAYEILRFSGHEAEDAKIEELGITEPMRAVVWPGGSIPGFAGGGSGQRGEAGLYRARIQVSGIPGLSGELPHLTVEGKATGPIFDADVLAPEEAPVILEFEAFLEMPAGLNISNQNPETFGPKKTRAFNGLRDTTAWASLKDTRLLNPTGYKLFTEDGTSIYPILLVDWIEWEGPIVSEETRQKRAELVPEQTDNVDEVRACLKRLACRAWRGPVTDEEIAPYMELFAGELQAGEPFDSAYRAAMVGILTSKNFYYLEQGSPGERRNNVNDWELASRLSYFLWSSMPDEELFAAAASGTLHEPSQLHKQFARMLADLKCERFLDSFPNQWLQLHRVGMFAPNSKLYPDYDAWLERSMLQETKLYFREMFAQNRPLREFLNSNWTIVNRRLRKHYGMAPTEETGFQQVALRVDDHRGGLLTQASILGLTSDGSRHRPVHRGVWLSEAVFNRTPPAPPPNVEPLEPTPVDAPKATVRMQLEGHATQSTCASCHRKIDPLGFAFENYDAIGRWRTEEEVSGKGDNPPANATGVLPDGRAFRGPEEFKALLVADQDRFAQAFVEQLATYALRRVMTIDDAAQIKTIVETSRQDGYRLRNVIENFVLSELFQKR